MQQYCYRKLPQNSNVTRLLRLLPRRDSPEHIRCELFEYIIPKSSTNPYEALSYCWGGEEKPKSILIIGDQDRKNDQELAVTENLYVALSRLQDCILPRIIWVDAVCIDQTNREEKATQIQLMPAIYAKACRVIVWLGAEQDGSDKAFDLIISAANASVTASNTQQPLEQEIQELLNRPWFSRVWVLQEIAAARSIVIMCGLAEIDGYVFCLGLDHLQQNKADLMCPVTYLIRQATFRSRNMSRSDGRLSSNVCTLGELVDKYHAHKATLLHDKVYALLGMASDDLTIAGLEPNYNVRWSVLMKSLIKFIISDHASVDTWDHRGRAIIRSKGYIFGQISSVKVGRDNRRDIQFKYPPRHNRSRNSGKPDGHLFLSPSAKPVKEGDVICLLYGAQKLTIARPHEDYFTIVMIAAVPPEIMKTKELKEEISFPYSFILVWDWEDSIEKSQDSEKYDTFLSKLSEVGLESQLHSTSRLWALAQILRGLGEHYIAAKKEQQALLMFEKEEFTVEHFCMMRDRDCTTLLLLAARLGNREIVALLLTKGSVDLDMKDKSGRTPLQWAAKNGHEAVVKLLLATGKVDVNAKTYNGQTAFSLAAEYGYEAVVKLLLDRGTEVNVKDDWGNTALLKAARGGHEAILKLLLDRGADVDAKDDQGITALQCATRRGHEAIVKLLLDRGVDVNAKDDWGNTALLKAAWRGHEAIVKLLLHAGASE